MGCCVSKSARDPILGKPYEDVMLHYTFGTMLGRGQFGVSYLCTENSTNRRFACKSIAKKPKMRQAENDMIRREIRIRQHLSGQPNNVDYKSAYEDETAVNMVIELCEGGNLFDRIIAKGYYSERDAASVFGDIANAVNVCHSMGVMHRDLKPENFSFISRDENALLKVTDFGSALLFEEGKVYSDIVGSSFYIAPEVLRRRYGKEIDIWSAGVILYFLLSGVPPFWAETNKGIYEAILQGEIDFETVPWPSISSSAKDLVRSMLTQDPKRRITAAEVLEHPWLKESGEASDDTSVILRMKQFRRMNKLKKLTIKVIVEYLPDEETQVLKEKFTEMDTDKNGTLSYDELRAGLIKPGSMLTEFDVKQLMEAADIDGNGAIDYIEFTAATIPRHKLERSEYLSKAFQYFDKDDSGYITLDELDTAFKENNMGDEATIKKILSDVDSNKDGMISTDEFHEMLKSPQTIRKVAHNYTEKGKKIGLGHTEQVNARNMLNYLFLKVIVENFPTEEMKRLREKFDDMDTDKSGTLTLDELKAGLYNLGSVLEESEVDQTMDAGDLDGNGNIDFFEFINLTTAKYKLETPELLEKVFQYFDEDKDKIITLSDLKTAFKKNNVGDGAAIDEIMSEVGRHFEDGRINLFQFGALVKGGSQFRTRTVGNLSYMF